MERLADNNPPILKSYESCSTNKNELIVQLGYAKLIIDHHFQNPTHSSTLDNK